MDVNNRGVVVTGAARGIGEALARRFHADGARVVVADLDHEAASRVASDLCARRPESAWSVGCDVGTAAGNTDLIAAAQQVLGSIDLFFANAGVGVGSDLESTDDATWQLAMNVNVHAHRWAAERLMPEWLARGEGYFCTTASAAGLLMQIGSGPYSVTKHAAVAFAEWLAVTYGDRGVKVSCLCPQGVNTNMLQAGDDPKTRAPSDVVRAAGRVLEPEEVAEVVCAAIADERFLILPHPEVHDYMERKTADHDRWLAGMRKLQARVMGTR
jgi:NAD(P)-dependent dehydrogenase (short-subunit alcohol dehydrogenase family)